MERDTFDDDGSVEHPHRPEAEDEVLELLRRSGELHPDVWRRAADRVRSSRNLERDELDRQASADGRTPYYVLPGAEGYQTFEGLNGGGDETLMSLALQALASPIGSVLDPHKSVADVEASMFETRGED